MGFWQTLEDEICRTGNDLCDALVKVPESFVDAVDEAIDKTTGRDDEDDDRDYRRRR